MEKKEQKLFHIKKDIIMAEKQEKREVLDQNILWDLDGKSLEDAIKYLQTLPLDFNYDNQYHRFELKIDYGHDDTGLILHGYRWETDKELASRLAKAKKERERKKAAKDSQEEKERKLYEELKKKFESPKPFGNY